ncbi:MAG: UDP-3-O-(3-hydroxymyristoyl)glucosamine N-acyltransferase [Phycisphaerae bacterium]
MLLEEFAETIGGRLTCDGQVEIDGIASLESAGPRQLAFLANDKYVKYMDRTAAAAVIVAEDYDGPGERLIRCDDAYFAFRNAMVEFYGFRTHPFEGIDASATVDPSASLGQNVAIGPGVYVGANTEIGDNTVLYPHVFIGPGCRLGSDCIIYPSVTLYDGSILGDRVTIHANCSIGHDGFGYATHKGVHEKIPQAGWVEIGDDVEIGACCAIDRAALGPTVVGAGTKFSDLIAIGHGTKLGRGCLLVAQVGIAGSVNVGDYCVFGGQAGVAGHIEIGEMARIGAQTGVTNSLQGGKEYWGTPAQPLAKARRTAIHTQKLGELASQVKQLTRQVESLQQKLDESPPE